MELIDPMRGSFSERASFLYPYRYLNQTVIDIKPDGGFIYSKRNLRWYAPIFFAF
jgi:hypothetical protein